ALSGGPPAHVVVNRDPRHGPGAAPSLPYPRRRTPGPVRCPLGARAPMAAEPARLASGPSHGVHAPRATSSEGRRGLPSRLPPYAVRPVRSGGARAGRRARRSAGSRSVSSALGGGGVETVEGHAGHAQVLPAPTFR